MRYIGVVEGFYGPYWNLRDRISMIEFLSRIEMDLYIYGPKWDPYHRKWWRNPYPIDTLNEFVTLIDVGRKFGVEVAIALSPGLDIDYSSRDDVNLLIHKFALLMDLGVDIIALFLDDIPPVVRGGFRSLAEAQAHLANTVFRELRPRKMILCPTFYYGVDEKYLKELGQLLDPEISVMWTGPRVCSIKISLEDLERVNAALGRKPFVWDNYPVNDYFTCRGITRLHVGPFRGRDPELLKNIDGYTANPANQVECSKIALYTAASMLFEGTSYDPEKAMREAVALLFNKSARYWVERFIEFNKANFMSLNEEEITRTNAEEVLEIVKNVRETVRNKQFLSEIEPVLNKMETIARYALGQKVELSWRIQTSGEYNPPIPSDRMVKEMFGAVVRRIPWYAEAYPKPEWW